MAMVREAYVNGISTRKIERLAKEMGIENISASQVSQIGKGLDEQVEAFCSRPLEKSYPFVWVDALYEKVRAADGRVVSTASPRRGDDRFWPSNPSELKPMQPRKPFSTNSRPEASRRSHCWSVTPIWGFRAH